MKIQVHVHEIIISYAVFFVPLLLSLEVQMIQMQIFITAALSSILLRFLQQIM